MAKRRLGGFRRKPGSGQPDKDLDIRAFVKELKGNQPRSSASDYRERSLRIHGLICAKCAREFEGKDRLLLTVHHKDGNPNNNPPDGSNWENLCADCHDAEHSRGLLADYHREE